MAPAITICGINTEYKASTPHLLTEKAEKFHINYSFYLTDYFCSTGACEVLYEE